MTAVGPGKLLKPLAANHVAAPVLPEHPFSNSPKTKPKQIGTGQANGNPG
jgi:hypothetical protein